MIQLEVTFATDSKELSLDHLAALLIELDKIHHEAAPDRFPLFSLEMRKKDLEKILDQGSIVYAEHDSQIVGFASLLKKKDALMIEHLFVKPEFRFKGIATQMVTKIFDEFSDVEIFASVYAFNKEAIKFYSKLFTLSSLVFKKS